MEGLESALGRILPGRLGESFAALERSARRDVACIAVAAVLFVFGMAVRVAGAPVLLEAAVFALAYLAVGTDILAASVRNIRAGDFFDENLLMSIASIGAFALGEFPEAVAVMLFYRVGEFFEDRATDRSRDAIMDAVDMRPETVNLLPGYRPGSAARTGVDDVKVVPAADAQVGDYMLVRPGERIPLDATVVDGRSRLDTSPVTGEPVPVAVAPGDAAISGCLNGEGLLVLRVDAPLATSMVTRILDAVEHAAANKPHMERFITRFARVYTPIVIAIAAATALVGSLATGDVGHWIYTACTFLVISCPCAIVLSVPLSFFAGLGAASKLGILFKGGNVIEAVSNVRAVVMDKTGTVTRGTFEVQEVAAFEPFGEDEVLQAAACAEAHSTHPIAASIMAAARARGLACAAPASVREVAGQGICAQLGEAGHGEDGGESLSILCGNALLMQREGIALSSGFDPSTAQGATQVLVAIDGALAGAILIADVAKPDAQQAVSLLAARGLHTVMLTGDADGPAQAVADAVGIDEVRARLLPQDKVEQLEAVRKERGSVMFVGDGINDAPVLAGADVGVAMGSGSDAAIQAADAVVLSSNLTAVAQAFSISHAVRRVAIQNIAFALAVKLGIMVLGFAGIASMWAAVFADVGVALLCILNSVRILHTSY